MSDIPSWDAVPPCPLLETLRELSRSGGDRLFHPIDAGDYVVSIQASRAHCSIPAEPVPAADVTAWEVAIYDRNGRTLRETADPELLSLPREWRRYWEAGIGRYVPTPLVRVLLERFALGPDHFDRFILRGPDPE